MMKTELKIDMKEVLKAIFFNAKSIDSLSKKVDIKIGMIALFISVFLLAIPTEFNLSLSKWGMNFAIIFIGLFITLTMIFLLMKLMGSCVEYETFLSISSFILASSLIFVSLPILLIFEFVLSIKALSAVLFSLVPYYNFLIFGYTCEVVFSEEKGFSFRRTVIALLSMTLIFLFYFLLAFITV